MARTVYVGMSGGVDSSVAALLLKRQGFRVVGVFMKPWSSSIEISENPMICTWRQDRQDALRVAATLDIPLETWDFSREYGRKVAREMIDGYRHGITPNPDVECNRKIKFGLFYDRARKEGADFVATGHYARIRKRATGQWQLEKARDRNKDQTYFLWAIPRQVLAHTLFPVGGLLKSQVREIAAQAGLVTAAKKDSQGICFVGDLDVRIFLTKQLKPTRGKIIHKDGRVLGMHAGAVLYTIGQRHGMDIRDGGGPYYVVSKNIQHNTITVGGERDLLSRTATLTNMQWFGAKPGSTDKVSIKVRYRTPAHQAVIGPRGRITFSRPARAIAPGQSAVIYRGSHVLGGGILA